MSGRVRWSCGPVVVWLVIASPKGSTGIGRETWSLIERGKRAAQRWWWQQAGGLSGVRARSLSRAVRQCRPRRLADWVEEGRRRWFGALLLVPCLQVQTAGM